MKIRLVLVDSDELYIKRFTNVINEKYTDRIELNVCSSIESFQKFIEKNIVHIALIDEKLDISDVKVSSPTETVIFVSSANVLEKDGYKAVCKYQRVDMIYKALLGIVSESGIESGVVTKDDGRCNVVVFTSPKGGTGNTAMAVAFAINKARLGKKVFYLNLEATGVTDQFFTGEGNTTFSDVLFSVKNKKSNITMKMESDIRTSSDKVSFFASSRNAYDMAEMKPEDFDVIMRELTAVRDFDYLVIDIDFNINPIFEKLLCTYAGCVILVDDGSETGNFKTVRGIEVIEVLEKSHSVPLLTKTYLVYNRFSASKSSKLTDIKIQELGGCRRYEMADEMQIVAELAKSGFFEKI